MSETSPLFERRTDRLRELRTVSIRDQADRDAVASQVPRYRDDMATDWHRNATMHPEARRKVVRMLREISAGG
jgi:hypothetical protein